MTTATGGLRLPPGRKLPVRFHGFVMPLVLSILMSCIVSGVATLHATGLAGGFLGRWMGAWATSWMISLPTLIAVLPIVRRVVSWIVESPAAPERAGFAPGAGRVRGGCPAPGARTA